MGDKKYYTYETVTATEVQAFINKMSHSQQNDIIQILVESGIGISTIDNAKIYCYCKNRGILPDSGFVQQSFDFEQKQEVEKPKENPYKDFDKLKENDEVEIEGKSYMVTENDTELSLLYLIDISNYKTKVIDYDE